MIRIGRHRAGSGVANRYEYDFNLCGVTDQWTALETGLDGPQFGRWANPFGGILACYDNGVIERLRCDTDDEFTAQLGEIAKLHAINDEWNGINDCSQQLKDRFIAAGAGELIQPAKQDTTSGPPPPEH